MAANDPLVKNYRLRRDQWNEGQEIVIAGGARQLEGYTLQNPDDDFVLPFARAVSNGTVVDGVGDSQNNDYTCIVGGEDFVGVSTANKTRTGTQEEGYAVGINVPILEEGHIAVKAVGTAIVRGREVWYSKTDGSFSGTPTGGGAPDSTSGLSTTHVKLTNAKYKTSAAIGKLAHLQLS